MSENKHVNDLLNLHYVWNQKPTTPGWKPTIPGWDIDCSEGFWNSYFYDTCPNWYCYNTNDLHQNGSIKTTLSGNGRAKLDFGNCWNGGVVKVFLNNTEIALAPGNTKSKKIEFDYTDGNELKFVEEDTAIIMFNSFEVLNCTPAGKSRMFYFVSSRISGTLN